MTTLTKQELAEGIMMNALADLLEAKEEDRDRHQLAYFTALFTYALSEAFKAGLNSDRLIQSITSGYSQLEADGDLPMACFSLIDPCEDVASEDYANVALKSVLDAEIEGDS